MTVEPRPQLDDWAGLALDYCRVQTGRSLALHADCFEWLSRIPENSLCAIVTDPPYGVKEFEAEELSKRAAGVGGVWRIPPSFDGHMRSPLPRLQRSMKKNVAPFPFFYGMGAVGHPRPASGRSRLCGLQHLPIANRIRRAR